MPITAIILAGGVGSRMGADRPKQFIEIHSKPIIVHTIELFQKNDNVDDVLVVCNESWIDHMKSLAAEYNLTKVKWIISGGATSHDSTRNGLFFLKDKKSSDDYVIIHDAARPIIPQKLINEMIDTAKEKGNASFAIPCYETMIFTDDKKSGVEELSRDRIMRIQTPQMYRYGMLLELYEKCEEQNIHDIVYADIVAIKFGERVYFSRGFTNNIKITRREDIPFCEYLMNLKEEDLI